MSLLDAPPSYSAPSGADSATSSATPATPATCATPATPSRRLPPPPPPLLLPALNAVRGKRVILASASPRRRQLLSLLGLTNVEVIPSKFEENMAKTASPFEYVLATATQKAMAVYRQEADNTAKGEPRLIIAADTIVVSAAGDILEKPRSEAQHIHMLRTLRDAGWHKVYTAVALMAPLASARDPGYALETATEETSVQFDRDITDELLLAYVRTREGADKAGGYGIQGAGSVLVERIDGSFDNVVGLPLRVVLRLIEKVLPWIGLGFGTATGSLTVPSITCGPGGMIRCGADVDRAANRPALASTDDTIGFFDTSPHDDGDDMCRRAVAAARDWGKSCLDASRSCDCRSRVDRDAAAIPC
ncbi:hypothetical protein DV736_g816, partial [Chaetothyriales sp. CBS 134916]